jgi:hypothetical protein
VNELEELRRLRGNRSRDISIASTIAATASAAASTHKKLGELIEIWERHVPANIANRTTLLGIRAGVLNVSVDSSSTAFELDRLLRSGLLNELRREYRGTLSRVKWKIASEIAAAPETRLPSSGAKKIGRRQRGRGIRR